MTDQKTQTPENGEEELEWTAEQEHVREALRVVIDPELGIEVVPERGAQENGGIDKGTTAHNPPPSR